MLMVESWIQRLSKLGRGAEVFPSAPRVLPVTFNSQFFYIFREDQGLL